MCLVSGSTSHAQTPTDLLGTRARPLDRIARAATLTAPSSAICSWRRQASCEPSSAGAIVVTVDLAQARKFLGWANTTGFSTSDGLYAASNLSPTPIDYIQAPLIYAQTLLCKVSNTPADCEHAEQLKTAALSRFGPLLAFSLQSDGIYLQWMLALYSLDHDPTLYVLAADNTREVQARALNGEGLHLRSRNGETIPSQYALLGMLQTQAATTSLFAWLAVYPPP